MVTLTEAAAKPLTTFSWGKGITDIRLLNQTPETREEVEIRAAYYGKSPGTYNLEFLSRESALKSIKMTLEAAPPGVIFTGHPYRSPYSKWMALFLEAGFKVAVGGCAINFVMHRTPKIWDWKGGIYEPYKYAQYGTPPPKPELKPWDSKDRYTSWEHVLYFVKEPVPTLSFDFSTRRKDASNGDDLNSLWQINYGGREQVTKHPGKWLPQYGRLSKNCGIAMGYDLPECGSVLDEEFMTIAALPETRRFPKGWTRFLVAGGMKFGHNLTKLVASGVGQAVCPHNLRCF